jgi:hypothetical protein
MKILLLPTEKHYEFLAHVFETYARKGMPGDQLRIAAEVHECLMNVEDLPVPDNLGAAKVTNMGPNGVGLELVPDGPNPTDNPPAPP